MRSVTFGSAWPTTTALSNESFATGPPGETSCSPLRILFLALDVDLTANRGDSVHVRELAQHLVRDGHEVRLITASRAPFPFGTHYLREDSTVGQVLQASREARNWADVIYERRMSPKVSYAASRLTSIPFAIEVNGVLEEEQAAQGKFRGGVRFAIKSWIRRGLFARASKVVTVSNGIRKSVLSTYKIPPDRVEVVPNGANTSQFYPRNRAETRRDLNLPPEDFIVCFVGYMIQWQGIETLLDAAKSLDGRIPRLKVLLIGDGPDLAKFKAQATHPATQGLFQFMGEMPYEDVPKMVSASDVCVAPFDGTRKASPIKVFEYLACAKPVISSDVDEIGRFLRDTRSGIVIEANNAIALAEAIDWVYNHPNEAADLARRGREAVEQSGS